MTVDAPSPRGLCASPNEAFPPFPAKITSTPPVRTVSKMRAVILMNCSGCGVTIRARSLGSRLAKSLASPFWMSILDTAADYGSPSTGCAYPARESIGLEAVVCI